MPKAIDHINPEAFFVYDAIIDVRSPAEFAEDHIPGAINLPVLDNEERAEIGTLYVQVSRFLARRKGAAVVARNIAHHLDTALVDKPADFRPLVYCWRGGNRSGAMATIFERVGWHTDVLERGYKSWRRDVVDALRQPRSDLKLRLIDGMTGVGKTAFLKLLKEKGLQVIDLEGHANQLGSVFGGTYENQPSQKLFEGRIYRDLLSFDLQKPLYLEAESAKIGRLHIPKGLLKAMREAKRYEITGPIEGRVKRLLVDYQELQKDRDQLKILINQLSGFHAKAQIEEWLTQSEADDLSPLVNGLLESHYDPLYARARKKNSAGTSIKLAAKALDSKGLSTLVDKLMAL